MPKQKHRPADPRQALAAAIYIGLCLFLSLTAATKVFSQSAGQPQAALTNSRFELKIKDGAIVSLKLAHDPFDTEYITPGRRLGDAFIRFRLSGGTWKSVDTADLAQTCTSSRSPDGDRYRTIYAITNGTAAVLVVEMNFTFEEQVILWSVTLHNVSNGPLEVGDLAFPFPMNSSFRRGRPAAASVLKHSFVSGYGSFMFWMRPNSVGPYLTMTPEDNTKLEYWDAPRREFRAYIFSAAAGAVAWEHGTRWRQPNTSLMLASDASKTYGFKFQWAKDYDGVRQILVNEGKVDLQVVPGMTVPTNLFAEIALRTTQQVASVEPEFPKATRVTTLGTKGDTRLYRVQFSRLGENELTVHYGRGRYLYLEFFVTEPLETLFQKRAAFIADHQVRDTNKWYNGLFCEWNMEDHVQLTPDNHDRLRGFRIYAITCDDAGLGHPAYLAAENAEYPVQSQVSALDYYIQHFVWGGLQRTTNETCAYGIYGIPDWKTNRDSRDPGRNGQLHLWREYDYPHVILMYFSMYRIARYHPEIKTVLTAREYLERAYGTAHAMFTVPHEVWKGWSAYGTGFYNERIIVDLIRELQANGLDREAETLRQFWVRKVKYFVNDNPDLFGSEYPFDSTGFESTEALAKYAMYHADRPGETNSGIPLANAEKFLNTQIAANIFCRGWLEPAYYYLGSDYRAGAGNAYTLSYMSQMGGWAVLDYALNFATNPCPYLRLGYASSLSSWALMNSGTPQSNYGYWYPGKADDGGAGGGFEPAPYGFTWLGQPHHRGAWYYACEMDLGYCGALRTAATILSDDPIFGRFCYGGDWRAAHGLIKIFPKDGLRRRFHALLSTGRIDFVSEVDRFASGQPIVLKPDLSEMRFQLESDNPAPHVAQIHFSAPAGNYTVRDQQGRIIQEQLRNGQETILDLPMNTGTNPKAFNIVRNNGF
ncbi:MAG TPA: DUF5695 domain-containing protein [Verrucomicrobiae bacterium]|nr:DUF5695 domain-containing protein [Verrucomicrobiae bacterium]